MAGWSVLSNGFASNCVDIVGSNGINNGFLPFDQLVRESVVNDGVDEHADRLRSLFDRIVSLFLKEIGDRGIYRPVPAILGDGGATDLFKLFRVVRDKGGFDLVSKKGLWSLVAEELGLEIGLGASLKLIYHKYLDALRIWFLENCGDTGVEKENCWRRLFSSEVKSFLLNRSGEKGVKDEHVHLEIKDIGKHIDVNVLKNELKLLNIKCNNTLGSHDDCEKVHDDDGKICSNNKGQPRNSECIATNKEITRKRKRESLLGMLEWVTQIAKHSSDPSIGIIPEPFKWKEHQNEDFWFQAIRARDALLLNTNVQSNTTDSLLQKKIKMHPSMYEDKNDLSTEKLRCSERLSTVVKSHLRSCSNSCSATNKVEAEKNPIEKESAEVNSPAGKIIVEDDSVRKEVPVGPQYQAEVPIWTGMVCESDTKWLGTRVWPLECKEHSSLDPIGRGRADSCDCRLPGSVDCVRFHIAEKRMTLMLELGPVFYRWRFNHMGEEISLQWTDEEEKRFKDLVRENRPSLNKCFWNEVFKRFPKKTRRSLVSYYFNVFLVRRRSYQNRVTPKNVDSDDDELEFGSVGGGFGQDAVSLSDFEFLKCHENRQCTDFD